MSQDNDRPVLRMSAHRVRDVILSEVDLRALSAMIQHDFPHAVILRRPQTTRPPPREIPTFASLVDTDEYLLTMFLPREKWTPKIKLQEQYKTDPDWIWRWDLDRYPTPMIHVQRGDGVGRAWRLKLGGNWPPSIGVDAGAAGQRTGQAGLEAVFAHAFASQRLVQPGHDEEHHEG